ncbi:hypothetical protein ACFPM7_17800 [Actinokineospora guangxiensis]|uniref:Uncharacterized protein n=1 Tax=Actinokineospora guangxiensis TaxID=1490288 RepID=A0ABW0ENJ8_9PSEU
MPDFTLPLHGGDTERGDLGADRVGHGTAALPPRRCRRTLLAENGVTASLLPRERKAALLNEIRAVPLPA